MPPVLIPGCTHHKRLMTDAHSDATPRGPYRRFTAPDGREWLVWCMSEEAVDEIREAPSIGRAWLIFLGPDGETRRYAPVPPKWRRMSHDQLYELAQRSTALSRRSGP
jgi:hypothetical protein